MAKPGTDPPPADEPAVEPDEPMSRRGMLAAATVVVGCLAATALLLSGWTPGPGQPSPQRVGGSASPATTAASPTTTAPETTTVRTPRKRPLTARQISAQLFEGDCGICHTLAAAGTTGRVGPNLDKLRPSRIRVLDAIAAGGRRTGLMPPGILTGADAARVAAFVAGATRR